MLYLPGQEMSAAAQIALTERFGAVEPHPLKARADHPDYAGLLVLENTPARRA